MSSWVVSVGFVVLEALLIWSCLSAKAPAIQDSLSRNSEQRLAARNIDLGPGLVVDGRDAWLTGQVASEQIRRTAAETLESVRGIRVVHNLLTVNGAAEAAPAPVAPPPPVEAPEPAATEVQRSIDDLIAGRAVEFESGSARLTPRGRALVDEVAALLAQYPAAKVEIEGHTDSQGSADTNLDLSRRRAEAVRERLVQQSVETSRLTAAGYGEERPIADNDTQQGRLQNRRVAFTVQ